MAVTTNSRRGPSPISCPRGAPCVRPVAGGGYGSATRAVKRSADSSRPVGASRDRCRGQCSLRHCARDGAPQLGTPDGSRARQTASTAARTALDCRDPRPAGAHTRSTTSSGHGCPSTAISSPSSTGHGTSATPRSSAELTRLRRGLERELKIEERLELAGEASARDPARTDRTAALRAGLDQGAERRRGRAVRGVADEVGHGDALELGGSRPGIPFTRRHPEVNLQVASRVGRHPIGFGRGLAVVVVDRELNGRGRRTDVLGLAATTESPPPRASGRALACSRVCAHGLVRRRNNVVRRLAVLRFPELVDVDDHLPRS